MTDSPPPPAASLGEDFSVAVQPARFPKHVLRFRNDRWAGRVGLAALDGEAWTEHFGRFAPLPDNLAEPLALAYHGHQFRVYNPDIGDGRGFLFAQLRDGRDGRLLDLGTKGSGTTPFSRGGDGRLTLKGGVREVLATEGLEALGVYTSKSFSLIETGEALLRGDEPSPTRSAVLVRLSHSHIRFGAFQRLAFLLNVEGIETLLDHACALHFPQLAELPREEKPPAFLRAVAVRSARLAASWMAAGFVHGVLNTDNMNVTGESFDYGPWRFLPKVDPGFTAAYFDHAGLYAYGRQAEAVLWNLGQLGGALLPLSGEDALNEALGAFPAAYQEAVADAFFARLGLTRGGGEEDGAFVQDLLRWMQMSGAPFEQTMFDLFCGKAGTARRAASPSAALYAAAAFAPLAERLDAMKPERPERLDAPYFARPEPETLVIEEVERVWDRIDEADDWSAFEEKIAGLREAGAAYDLRPLSAPEGHVPMAPR
ncbi:protein adenylyltransferase SelO family protein [Parvularcula oceani]|uniref:protein adenylyltransferase SelO family protein n=1 Tax=Parvularcula oceani TaxID=1247963 RepID=UPI0006893E15|nr:YdiU family protein [Parvularcula oceani]